MPIADDEGVHGLPCSSPKSKHWENPPAQRPAKPGCRRAVAHGQVTWLREEKGQPAVTRRCTLWNSHFICAGVPAPTGAVSAMPRRLGGDAMSTLPVVWGPRPQRPHLGLPVETPHPTPCTWQVPSACVSPQERRAGEGGVPPWGCGCGPSCLPASRLHWGRIGSMSEGRLISTRPTSCPSLPSRSEAACAPNLGGAVCPVGVLQAEEQFVPGSACPWATCTVQSRAPVSHTSGHCSGQDPGVPPTARNARQQ